MAFLFKNVCFCSLTRKPQSIVKAAPSELDQKVSCKNGDALNNGYKSSPKHPSSSSDDTTTDDDEQGKRPRLASSLPAVVNSTPKLTNTTKKVETSSSSLSSSSEAPCSKIGHGENKTAGVLKGTKNRRIRRRRRGRGGGSRGNPQHLQSRKNEFENLIAAEFALNTATTVTSQPVSNASMRDVPDAPPPLQPPPTLVQDGVKRSAPSKITFDSDGEPKEIVIHSTNKTSKPAFQPIVQ